MRTLLDRIGSWPRGQWMLRALVVAGFVVALVGPALEGHRPGRPMLVVGVLLALCAGLAQDRALVTAAGVWVLLTWLFAAPDAVGAGTLLAAAGLVVAHVASLLTGYVPDRAAPDRGLVLRWLGRGALVWLPVLPAGIAVGLVGEDGPAGEGGWVWAAGAVLVALLALGASATMRTSGGRR